MVLIRHVQDSQLRQAREVLGEPKDVGDEQDAREHVVGGLVAPVRQPHVLDGDLERGRAAVAETCLRYGDELVEVHLPRHPPVMIVRGVQQYLERPAGVQLDLRHAVQQDLTAVGTDVASRGRRETASYVVVQV